MKKEYISPQVEKIEFNYEEQVEACPSGCHDPSHWWHQQQQNNDNNNNNNNNNNNGSNSYWGVAWGRVCS